MRTVLQALIVTLAAASLSYSQAQKKTQAPAKRHDLDSRQKLQLLSIGAVDPNALVQAVAAESAKQKVAKSKAKANATSSAEPSDVSEFQTVSHGSNPGTPDLVLPDKSSSKAKLKNIHGEVYGGLAPGISSSNEVSGAAGATSKNGKTSIFIQTNHASNPE